MHLQPGNFESINARRHHSPEIRARADEPGVPDDLSRLGRVVFLLAEGIGKGCHRPSRDGLEPFFARGDFPLLLARRLSGEDRMRHRV